MENIEFTTEQVFKVGHRVEIHPGCDLWMQGARFGQVRGIDGDTVKVKMDHPQVKKLVAFPKDRIRHTRF